MCFCPEYYDASSHILSCFCQDQYHSSLGEANLELKVFTDKSSEARWWWGKFEQELYYLTGLPSPDQEFQEFSVKHIFHHAYIKLEQNQPKIVHVMDPFLIFFKHKTD